MRNQAHCVVNPIGLLTGKAHFSGSDRMQKLLESEGVKVEKDRIVDFCERFWDPMAELDLER